MVIRPAGACPDDHKRGPCSRSWHHELQHKHSKLFMSSLWWLCFALSLLELLAVHHRAIDGVKIVSLAPIRELDARFLSWTIDSASSCLSKWPFPVEERSLSSR